MYSCLKSTYNDVIIKQTKTEKLERSKLVEWYHLELVRAVIRKIKGVGRISPHQMVTSNSQSALGLFYSYIVKIVLTSSAHVIRSQVEIYHLFCPYFRTIAFEYRFMFMVIGLCYVYSYSHQSL